jgi:predicted dienelactone hydrolase
MEFLNRPQEITFLIDELERMVSASPTWAARMDLDRIGMFGDSLGGSTALALAGAPINHARLVQSCDSDEIILNFSLYLQCQARFLPPRNYNLRDDRIKAVLVTHPLGGFLYGPEGMSQITVPLLMIAGSQDIVAPVVTEQIHPYIWLQSEPKYLALLDVGTHFSSKPGRESAADTQDVADEAVNLLIGEHRDVGTRYAKTLNIAFWNSTLRNQTDYLPYLTASYAIAASADQPMRLDLIQNLTPEQLEAAYGRPTPIPVIPPAIAELPPPRDESILAEVARTGVLQVAMRRDAAPFGFINPADEVGWLLWRSGDRPR